MAHIFFLYHLEKTWDNASSFCNTRNAYLLKIDNEEENNLINELTNDSYWIGLHDYDGRDEANKVCSWTKNKYCYEAEISDRWKWLDKDGNDVDSNLEAYNNWNDEEPNNSGQLIGSEDCVEIRADGTWNDNECSGEKFFICEKEILLP